MKKWVLGAICVIILFIMGGYIGYAMYSLQDVEETPVGETRLAVEETEENKLQNEMIAVVAVTKKIQPQTNMLIKEYYTKCDHLIQEEQLPQAELINKTEEELQAYYTEYTIESFSEEEVVLYKEYKEWCPKHFVLREDKGCIVVYRLNAQGKESVVEKTDILVEYLPEEDKQRLAEGIALFGEELLNATLEDFE